MDCVRREKPHQGQIMDLQTNKDLTFLISSSKDCTSKVKYPFEIRKNKHFLCSYSISKH